MLYSPTLVVHPLNQSRYIHRARRDAPLGDARDPQCGGESRLWGDGAGQPGIGTDLAGDGDRTGDGAAAGGGGEVDGN